MAKLMFVISAQDELGHRYDVSKHSMQIDAEAHLVRVQNQLVEPRIEEKDTYTPKPSQL